MKLLLALLFLLAPFRALALDNAATGDAAFAFHPHLGAQLPIGAVLRDEHGRRTTLGAVLGTAPLVLALGYFKCPNICGVVRDDILNGLDRAGLKAGTDYKLLVLSIDPRESPQDAAGAKEGALSRYTDPADEADWRFLTGPKPGVDAIAAAAGFPSRYDKPLDQFLHPAGIVFASPEGVISSYLLGVGYQPSEVRSAVLRAGEGAIASAFTPVLLLCFHFDPKTGTYDFAVYRALSALAALTIVTLLALFLLLQRQRSRA